MWQNCMVFFVYRVLSGDYLCFLIELCGFIHCVGYVDIDCHLHLGYVTLQEVVYVSRVLYTT